MKKLLLFILLLIIVAGGIAAWLVIGPATSFNEKKKALYIHSNAATKGAVLDSLKTIVSHETLFAWLADRMDLWKSRRRNGSRSRGKQRGTKWLGARRVSASLSGCTDPNLVANLAHGSSDDSGETGRAGQTILSVYR